MGVENNEAVLATTWNKEVLAEIIEYVEALPENLKRLFVFVPSLSNGKTTIFLAPDGSKKGWPISERVNTLRDDFILLLETFKYEDDSSPVDWVEVGYGEYGQKVLRGNCSNKHNNKAYA